MNIELFFEKMTNEFDLGNIISKPLKVTGGLTQKKKVILKVNLSYMEPYLE